MTASTEGTPSWLLRLEQAQMQLKPDNYVQWLLTKAPEHGIPQEVITAQLERMGIQSVAVDTPSAEQATEEEVATEVKKRGRKKQEQ